jgi:hypothetical protein
MTRFLVVSRFNYGTAKRGRKGDLASLLAAPPSFWALCDGRVTDVCFESKNGG